MTVHQFIRSRQSQWKELEQFIGQAGRVTLSRVPLSQFRRGSLLYRETVADLGYARMRFPGHAVVGELERLVGQAHSVIYQAQPLGGGRGRPAWWWQFWARHWPCLVLEAARQIGLAAGIFWAAAAVGLGLTALHPVLEGLFISPAMREAMDQGQLWTQSITRVAPLASSAIATNNISVSLLAWALGVSFGIGTVWLLVVNGLMLGAVAAACLRSDLFGALAEFVVAHGSLELPAIWIAGGAGLLLGQSMLFPGRYARRVEMRLAGRRSVQIVAGVIPMLLIAAAVEGFVSPSNLPSSLKALLAVALAVGYVAYIVVAGRQGPSARAARTSQ